MTLYILLAVTIIISYLIAVYQKIRGLKFWTSFVKALIGVAGILGTIWKLLS